MRVLRQRETGGTVLIMEGKLDGNYREIQASFALHFHNGFVLISFFFLVTVVGVCTKVVGDATPCLNLITS